MDAQSRQRLSLLLGLVIVFAGVEWLVGSLSNSLSLQSDAGHMLTDAGAIGLALLASWLTRLTLRRQLSGQPRLEFAAALINSVGLLVMAGLISWEAFKHLTTTPTQVLSGPMLLTALLGLGINGMGVWILHADSHQDLKLRGAFLHVVADLASSVGVIVGAVAIYAFHWLWLDSVISLAIALLIGTSAVPLLLQSWQRLTKPPASLEALGMFELGRTDLSQLITRRKE